MFWWAASRIGTIDSNVFFLIVSIMFWYLVTQYDIPIEVFESEFMASLE